LIQTDTNLYKPVETNIFTC